MCQFYIQKNVIAMIYDISKLFLFEPLLGFKFIDELLILVLKAWVKGSTWIPIFDTDTEFDIGTLSRKVSSYMMGITRI